MKNVLIVGAGKGIGLRVVELLHKDYNVYTITRNITPELGKLDTNILLLDAVSGDLALLGELPEVIDGLLYCPGSILLRPFNRLSEEDFIRDYKQNVTGAVRIIQKVLPNLKKSGNASVVLMSTVAAKTGMPFHASIASAKSAVEGLVRSLAAEYAASGIRFNAIAPSLTDTPLASALLSTPEKREAAAQRHPLKRLGTPDDIAKAVEFLLSDGSSWITGQIIGVDGGLSTLKV